MKTISENLESKIKTYSRWLIEECDDPYDEVEYLVNLILNEEAISVPQMLEVLEMYKNYKLNNYADNL